MVAKLKLGCVTGFLLCAALAHAQIALLGHTKCITGGVSCTTPSINTAGASLLLMVTGMEDGGSNDVSVGSTPSNTWHALTNYVGGGNSGNVQIWYVYAPTTSSSQTFSCTDAGPSCLVMAFSGTLTTSSVFDAQNGAHSSGLVTSLATGNITPAGTGELIITGWSSFNNNTGLSVSGSFSILDNGCNSSCAADAYFIDSSSSSIGATWSVTGSGAGMGVAIAAFKPAPSAGCTRTLMGAGPC